MLISEIYESCQGEGLLTGNSSIFLRTSGCNLRCWFCDTPFTSWNAEGEKLEIESVVGKVSDLAKQKNCQHVVITGGEPMLQKEIVQLTQMIQQLGLHITIETAGTVWHDVECDLVSISPKLSNSTPSLERAGEWAARHEKRRNSISTVRKLIENFEYQLKFVVDTPDDFQEIENYITELQSESDTVLQQKRILLMPQGVQQSELAERAEWLQPYCVERGYTFSPRKHIEWYGNKRGT